MYILAEYLTTLGVVTALAASLFCASVLFIVTKEGATRAAASSRKVAQEAREFAKNHIRTLQLHESTEPPKEA